MAKLLIKYSTQSGEPQKLNYRELGIHNNHLYFGNSSNTPIRLAEYSDIGGGGGGGNVPIATPSTAGIVKATNSGSAGLGTYVDTDGTLRGQMPGASSMAGLYTSGTTIYPHDGAWVDKMFTDNEYSSLGFSYSSARNFYNVSSFNTTYVYPNAQSSLYPITVTIACYISSSSYKYDIKPVNANGSTTATKHMFASSWDDIELVVGGWLVYTVKLMYTGTLFNYKYLWTREVYTN